MENNLDNALKYVRDIDSIDEGWSESEKTLALYMVNYAEKVSKNEFIGHVSGIAFRDNLLRKADEMKESGIIWQSNKVYIEGIHCALDNMKTHIKLMFNKHYS